MTDKADRIIDEEISEAGEAPGKMEVDSITLDQAREFIDKKFKAAGKSLDEELPDFDKNFEVAQKLTRVGKTKRKDMPVIEDHQVKEFQARLKKGNIDIVKPFSDKTDIKNPFPKGLSSQTAKDFMSNGVKDGEESDDKINVKSVSISAKDLKPIQRQIYFDKSMGMTAKFGIDGTKKFLKSSLMVMSGDNYIIDGHHRWLSTLIIDPNMKLSGIKIELPIKKLLPLSLSYGDALGNKRNESIMFERTAEGHCYESAMKAITFGGEFEGTGFDLVHGIVTLTGGQYEGLETGHAWIEKGNDVYDTEKQVMIPKQLYYDLGNINYSKKYEPKEAAKQASDTGHYGPWDRKIMTAGDLPHESPVERLVTDSLESTRKTPDQLIDEEISEAKEREFKGSELTDRLKDGQLFINGSRLDAIPVDSLIDAARKVREYIEDNDFGASDVGGRPGTVYVDGKLYARISYNGRVWDPWSNK